MNKVRQALYSDCVTLIENFAERDNADFQVFCEEWKRLRFQHVYSGLTNIAELIQITDEMYIPPRELLFDKNRSQLDRIGSLYLLYSIYFKQPTIRFCKIKINLQNWCLLKEFIDELKTENKLQPVYIFYKLIESNAFTFCFTEFDYGFDDFYDVLHRDKRSTSQYLEKTVNVLKNDLKELTDENEGLLSGFEILEDGYNEVKSNLQLKNGEKIGKTKIFDKLKLSLQNIQEILDINKLNNENEQINNPIIEDNENSIKNRRAQIRDKAQGFYNDTNKEEEIEDKGEYNICLEGDVLKMTRKQNSFRYISGTQPVSKILNSELHENARQEYSSDENEKDKLKPSTSQQEKRNKKSNQKTNKNEKEKSVKKVKEEKPVKKVKEEKENVTKKIKLEEPIKKTGVEKTTKENKQEKIFENEQTFNIEELEIIFEKEVEGMAIEEEELIIKDEINEIEKDKSTSGLDMMDLQ